MVLLIVVINYARGKNLTMGGVVTLGGIDYVRILPGQFRMGSREEAPPEIKDLEIRHAVSIDTPFLMSAHEITNEEFLRFVNDSGYIGGEDKKDFLKQLDLTHPLPEELRNLPVTYVSQLDAEEYCSWLSKKENRKIRLPKFVEWEYACRANTNSRYGVGDDEQSLSEHAWYAGNSGRTVHAVGSAKSNPWKLFDMNGNVWEWTATEVPDQLTEKTPFRNRICAFIKGGSFLNSASSCRCAVGWAFLPLAERSNDVGFRIVADSID